MPVNGIGSSAPVNQVSTSNGHSQANSAPDAMNGMMGKDGFMKLFLASLKFQDPMSPMETKDMMAQMSQLTMVESISNLSTVVEDLKGIAKGNPFEKGVGFLGKEVSGVSAQGELIEGTVNEISSLNGNLELMIGGKKLNIAAISSVADTSAYEKFL